jgi:uncharacterized protein (TIGR02680 family)
MTGGTVGSLVPAVDDRPLVSVDEGRWRPTRAGLLNVWQYADEVLEPERGRMVLYGPNGSGKTMALELLLPHLLDARGQPGRLSTSGADRGGLWERVTGYREGEPRTGYLWVEHRRGDGEAFTIGVRLRAKPSGGGEKHWFTTSRRVGIDFALLDEHRRPLSVEQLAEAVGAAGKVWGHDTAGYRNAVRTTLFPGWSEDRLDALIRTLLVVRKQSVTDGLSSPRLSTLLSEALPPLDDLELGRVADGFADLDRRRDHISQLEEDIAATRRLADANRAYARAFVSRVTGEVVAATTAFDNVTRDVRRLVAKLEECERRVAELEATEAALEREDHGLAGRLDGLESSEAYRRGAELNNLRDAATGAKRRADEAQREATDARQRAGQRRKTASEAARELELAEEQCKNARRELEQAAERLAAPSTHDVADAALGGLVRTFVDARKDAIRKVRACLDALARAIEGRDAARRHRDGCERACSRAEEALRAAVRSEDHAIAAWRNAVVAWHADARELGPFVEVIQEPTTAAAAVADARSRAREPLLQQRERKQRRYAELESEIAELAAERDAWLAGKDPEPEPPSGRRDRTTLAGAPLWRLLQFREGVDDTIRGSIEAALLDAGVLDAWVGSDGTVRLADGEVDVLVDLPSASARGGETRTLAEILEADPAGDVTSQAAVERLLSLIPLVDRGADLGPVPEAGLVVGADGSWRTPRLVGRAPIGPAQYIGASSREATRRARIAVLEEQIAAHEADLRELEDERETLDLRITRCDEEARAFPSARAVEDARREVDMARAREETTRDALVEANARLTDANTRVGDEQRKLHNAASAHSLPTEPPALDAIDGQLGGLLTSVSAFETRHTRSLNARGRVSDTESIAAEAEADAHAVQERARTRSAEHEEAAARFAAVQEAVGADYQQVLEEIVAVKARRADILQDRKRVEKQQREHAAETATAKSERAQAEARREAADTERARVTESFALLCRDGLVADAAVGTPPAPDALTSATAILEAARRVRSTGSLPSPPDDATLVKLNNTVMARVADASRQLAGRADLTFDASEHGWSVLRARREGVVSSAPELLDTLREDLEAARAELTRKQQELFEQILSGSVREHLKDRLWAAQALVDRINGLLGQVRTEAGGVRVDLKWEIDPDQSEAAELRRAKELLLHDSPIASGRADLDAFLRSRIEQIRAAEDDTGEWRDRLARMLDYRQWHRFRVLVHHNRFGDTPRPLDSKRVSLSAGEKTIVMVLPLLAAVTAHYEPPPGDPPCSSPRFLLMDELFPKLDFPNKRKLMGLLPKLDLDAVFTSDKDRCEYDTLDGIAIHVFQKHGDDETTTTRLVWNGVETRVSLPEELATLDDGDGAGGPTLTPVED